MTGDTALGALRRAREEGATDLRERVRAAVEARRAERGGHAAWGAFCEEVGEFGLAYTEYQLALRDDETDIQALRRLVELSEERGDLEQAAAYGRRLLAAEPGDPEVLARLVRLLVASEAFAEGRAALEAARTRGVDATLLEQLEVELRGAERMAESNEEAGSEPAEPGERPPTDAEAVRFAHLFAGREDVYARQWWGEHGQGGYSPVREPFTPKVARNHLLGGITVGVYPVRLDDTVTFCAFDIDLTKRAIARARGSVQEARRLKAAIADSSQRLLQALEQLGLPALMEESGYKGRHLWLFFERPEPARVVHQFGALVLAGFELRGTDVHLEFFPKQASAGSGLGNLIKLPLGIHRRTGRRSRLLRPTGEPEPDPLAALWRHPKISREQLHAAIATLKADPGRGSGHPAPLRSEGEAEGAAESVQPTPRPAPPAPPPAWTAADFETNPEIAQLLRRCPVLGALKTKVDRHRQLTHDEQVVLIHALGHSAVGVLAVNYLLDACIDVPVTARLQTPLSGNPISCPKIRKRIPTVTAAVDCNCAFPFAPTHYPTPRLHLLTLQSEAMQAPERKREVVWDPVERARALGVLWARREQILAEVARLESELMSYMERERLVTLETGDGTLCLVIEEGAPPALLWRPLAGAAQEQRANVEAQAAGALASEPPPDCAQVTPPNAAID